MCLEEQFLPEDVEEMEERFEAVVEAMALPSFTDWMERFEDIDWG